MLRKLVCGIAVSFAFAVGMADVSSSQRNASEVSSNDAAALVSSAPRSATSDESGVEPARRLGC
ncbi:hypothetical protein KRR26_22250 [Corallococcus sp. M34]|uniref:hypothetical protein n=1 Tax=Citreicoccus inhibens TaxID=2849499 RepID=UPI001C2235D7|nr:hypothetical protein [Citreicoccus inhibens]MBU8898337.1 hypothetical protein [Citreicoccus inhibens]